MATDCPTTLAVPVPASASEGSGRVTATNNRSRTHRTSVTTNRVKTSCCVGSSRGVDVRSSVATRAHAQGDQHRAPPSATKTLHGLKSCPAKASSQRRSQAYLWLTASAC